MSLYGSMMIWRCMCVYFSHDFIRECDIYPGAIESQGCIELPLCMLRVYMPS